MLFSLKLAFLEIGFIKIFISSCLNSISPDGRELRIFKSFSHKTVVEPGSTISTGISVSKLILVSVALIVNVPFSALKYTLERIDKAFFVEIIS